MNNSVWYFLLVAAGALPTAVTDVRSGSGRQAGVHCTAQPAIHANQQLPVKNQYVVRLNKE